MRLICDNGEDHEEIWRGGEEVECFAGRQVAGTVEGGQRVDREDHDFRRDQEKKGSRKIGVAAVSDWSSGASKVRHDSEPILDNYYSLFGIGTAPVFPIFSISCRQCIALLCIQVL